MGDADQLKIMGDIPRQTGFIPQENSAQETARIRPHHGRYLSGEPLPESPDIIPERTKSIPGSHRFHLELVRLQINAL